jgi:hypothetical protein
MTMKPTRFLSSPPGIYQIGYHGFITGFQGEEIWLVCHWKLSGVPGALPIIEKVFATNSQERGNRVAIEVTALFSEAGMKTLAEDLQIDLQLYTDQGQLA